ncbi:MAG: hypothetical protein QOI12_843, partial [Alphaproteobacteria bacterium]|nr:hypothetical protein [Alphaproteobacteria bacterium]
RVKISAQANRNCHDEPPSFAMLNQNLSDSEILNESPLLDLV